MSDACREWRGELAATAAGRPDRALEAGLTAHLDGCPQCRAELAELRGVARTLVLVDVDRLADPPRPPVSLAEDVVEAVATQRRRRDRSTRGRSVLVAAVAAAALCAAIVGFVVVALGDDPSGGQRVAFTDAPAGVEASAQLRATDWGTEIEPVVDGLADDDAPDDVYWLWLSTADGDRVAAGTFRGDGTIHMAAALPLDEAARVWVTDAADDVVLDAVLS